MRGTRHTRDRPCPKSYDMHLGLELGIVLRGEMMRHYPGDSRSYGPGEMWFHDIGESHGMEVRKAPTEAVVLIIHPPELRPREEDPSLRCARRENTAGERACTTHPLPAR